MFVTKDAAVLNASGAGTLSKPSENGSQDCTRCSRYRTSRLITEKPSTPRKYAFQDCPFEKSTPMMR